MIYIQLFLYLQVLDLFTSLIGFKLGLGEASPFIRTLMRFGPVLGVALSKGIALLLAAFCLAKERHRLIRAINYWYAGLITWNLCAIWPVSRPGDRAAARVLPSVQSAVAACLPTR